MGKKVVGLVLLIMLVVACNSADSEFSGEQAYDYLVEQCEIGTREPGSQGHKEAKQMYLDFFNDRADTVFTQEFDQRIEVDNVSYKLTNIISGFNLENGDPLLVGAHWDTRPRAERDPNPANRNKPIIGANDGASGVAVLMHLAELLEQSEFERTVYLVLFDGEDYGYHGDNTYFCLGSKYFVRNMPIQQPEQVIIVDMIGDAQLSIPMERYSYRSDSKLMRKLWKIAQENGYDQYKHHLGQFIYDDHVPFIEAGIKAIDLIDFHYPNRHVNYWHTHQDTPDKCSPQSLEAVGQVLYDYIIGK
ncbi:MAG: M28 family peptidase [Candidatus Marinimicrobia bacterium]|nr:M28 family peptidase [Candidatus Neomarinimicrobiota bacterium]